MPEKIRLLAVDDDKTLLGMLDNVLTAVGYQLHTATSLFQARGEVRKCRPDLIILDRKLPDGDGLSFVQELRAQPAFKALPVLFLTARRTPSEKAEGLRAGGDDYLAKPFSGEEFLARIEALLRRSVPAREPQCVLKVQDLMMDIDRHVVELRGKPLHLSPKEFELLTAFIEARGRVLSRPFLLERVWGSDSEPNFKTVDVAVGRLRNALGSWGKRLVAVQSFGYRLDVEG